MLQAQTLKPGQNRHDSLCREFASSWKGGTDCEWKVTAVTHSACLGVFWYSGVHVQCLSVYIYTEAQQWESLTAESREQLIRSLSTMASDSRPELQEKAFILKKTLENLD